MDLISHDIHHRTVTLISSKFEYPPGHSERSGATFVKISCKNKMQSSLNLIFIIYKHFSHPFSVKFYIIFFDFCMHLTINCFIIEFVHPRMSTKRHILASVAFSIQSSQPQSQLLTSQEGLDFLS